MPERQKDSLLEVYDIRTDERKVLKSYPNVIEAPNWSKDGKDLIFNRGGHIVVYNLESGNETEIDTGFATFCNNDHVLSSDGKSIAVSHHTAEDRQSRIYTLPLSGGTPSLITPLGPSFLHGWSPDGKMLTYAAGRKGAFNIYVIPAIGGCEKQLTDTEALNDGPEYSPCGKYIWFCSTRSGLMQIWKMNSEDGSNPVQITFDEANCWFPHISPDEKWVLYMTYAKGDVEPRAHPIDKNVELRLIPAEGGKYKTLAKLFGGQGTINVNSWSPDSTRFAFVSYPNGRG